MNPSPGLLVIDVRILCITMIIHSPDRCMCSTTFSSIFFFFFFFFALIYFIYPFAIKKKESREGEGSKPSIETMYSNFYIKILLYIYIVSI